MATQSSSDLNKTWIPGPSRGTQTFNAPSTLTIPYGRFLGSVSGRGGSGSSPTASSWATNYNTNYNVAYPIANQPIATQPATAWATNYNTNYNVAYPIANQPIATQPATAWATNYNTNYNVAYPVANRPIANQPATAWATNYNTNYNVAHVVAHHIGHYYTYYNFPGYQVHGSFWTKNQQGPYPGSGPHFFQGTWYHCPSPWHFASPCCAQWANFSCPHNPGNIAYGAYHQSSTHAVYPVGNQPVANQPATTWATNYNTNYNTVYPIANRPIANQPATTWATNYNTNYNVVYPIATQPIANQPITAYTPGNPGTPTNVLGVTFPGGGIDLSGFAGNPGTAPYVGPTTTNYWSYPDNATYPVSVPPGGQIVVNIS